MFNKITRLLIIILSLMLTSTAFAQDTNDSDRPYTLGEVVVSADREITESITTVNKITARQIKDSGASTLDEAISLIPGLDIRIGGQGTPRVNIRGLRTRHVQLLLDGSPINDTADGQFDPTSFPVGHIAEIKLVTGASSVLYGPGGNGGVINIITKKGEKGLAGNVKGEYGTGNYKSAEVSVSGGTEKFDILVSANERSRNYFPLSDDFQATNLEDGDERENSDHKRGNQFANLGFSPNDSTLFSLMVNTVQGENGTPPRTYYNAADPFSKKIKYQRVDDIDGYNVQAGFSHQTSLPLEIKGWGYVNKLEQTENIYDDDTYTTQDAKNSATDDTQSEITGANLQAILDLDKMGTATIGVISEDHDWKGKGWTMGKAGAVTYHDNSSSVDVKTIALEHEIKATDSLGLMAGISYHTMDGNGITDKSGNSMTTGANYTLSKDTSLRASYSRKLRFPSISQLYDITNGNTTLNAEKSSNWEAGISHNLPCDTGISFTGFHMDVKNLIEKDAASIYQNNDRYRFKGFETSLINNSIENLTVKASYSYLNSKDKSPGSEKDKLEYRPENIFSIEGTYRFPAGLTLHSSLLRVADQIVYDSDGVAPLESRDLNNYTLVNLKVSQSLRKNKIDLFLKADNLFDENYEESIYLPQAGRVISGGAEIRF